MIRIAAGTEANTVLDIHYMAVMDIIKAIQVVVQQYTRIGLIDISFDTKTINHYYYNFF